MCDILIQHSILQKVVIKTLLVSIPEELFLVMFTLIIVGEFEYWQEPECKRLINRFDYVRVFLPTLVGALLSNILRSIGLNYGFYQFITPIVIYILIVLTNDVFGDAYAIKWIIKAFISFMVGFLFIGISEFIYAPFIIYGTNLTMAKIQSSLLLYFMTSLPPRFLQYFLLCYLVSKKRTFLKGQLLRNILSSPVLSVIFSILVLINILFLWLMYKIIVFDRVLISVSPFYQVFIIISVILFPMLNLSGLIWSSYLLKSKETKDKKSASEQLHSLLRELELYTFNGKYSNIRWKLNKISTDIEEVANNLYKEKEIRKKQS